MIEKTSVWMPLYVKDYLADTQRLSTVEHGAYLLLIIDYWISGRLDDDDEQLARITKMNLEKWRKIKPKITSFFLLLEGQWTHPRIEAELSTAKANRLEAKLRAAKGGAATKRYWENVKKQKERLKA